MNMNNDFNVENAVPISQGSQGATAVDTDSFTPENAVPVDAHKGLTQFERFINEEKAINRPVSGQEDQRTVNDASSTEQASKGTTDANKWQSRVVDQSKMSPVELGKEGTSPTGKKYREAIGPSEYPDEGWLNAGLHTAEGSTWNMVAKPILGMKDPSVDKYLSDIEKQHPIASTIAGTAPYIASSFVFPESLLPNVWGRMAVQFGSVSALSSIGHERVDEDTKSLPQKALSVAEETAKGAAFSPIWAASQKLQFIGRPFATALARAGVIGVGSSTMSTFFGDNITQAFKQGGILGALSLISEGPHLAKTVIGRGIISHTNTVTQNSESKINPYDSPENVQTQVKNAAEELSSKIPGIDKPHIVAATIKLADGTEIYGASHEDALNKIGMTKSAPPSGVKIPEFKNTEQAMRFGRENKDRPDVLQELLRLREEALAKNKVNLAKENPTPKEEQQMLDDAVKGQFFREAMQGANYKPYESGFTAMYPDGSTKFITREDSMRDPFNLPTGHSEEVKGLNESKFLNPPKELKIVNPDTLKMIDNNEGKVDIGMLPGVPETAEVLQKSHAELKEKFAPYNEGEEGKFTAQTLRENLGIMARSHDKLEASLNKSRDMFENLKKDPSLDFIYRMEEGKEQDNKNLQKIAFTLRNMLDSKRDEVIGLGTGKLENWIENYFPHVWENPNNVGKIIGRIMGRRPFEGPKSFLKKRTIPTTREGIELGFTPVSYNPIDSVMLKIREMDRYIMAHKTINALKNQGLIQFVRVGSKVPDDFVKIDDRFADVVSKNEKGELIIRGKYYAQTNAARILNNYLSPGLRGRSYLYDMYRGAGNTLNQFQLGLSAFHLGFTSMDATISKFALGINKLSTGDFSGAIKEFGKAPFAPITNIIQGRQLLQAWYGNDKGELTNTIASLMASGGGRAKMDKFYATQAKDSMQKALKEGKILSASLKVPYYIVEQISKPIMEYIVPRQKMGVFMDMMKMEMGRNPNLTHDQLVPLAQKAWDSVDNRMGQLVYDNLFWNRTVKDLSMASVRSLGWNLGTIREIGGGVKDVIGNVNDLIHGKGTKVSYRTAYIMALPIVTGLYGAIYQYLHTGQGPQELKDYFFPKNGAIDNKGQAARISLPTYMKDIYHYTTNPVQTVINKFSPVNNAVLEMINNKDFYGTEIRNLDDPAMKQVLDEVKFMGSQFEPFGFRNLGRDTRTSLGSKVEPFIGITPAPYDINMTKAEREAYNMMKDEGKFTRTQEQAQHDKQKSDLRNQYMATKDRTALDEAVSNDLISNKEKRDILKEANMSNLQRLTKRMTFEQVEHVLKSGNPTDTEKEELLKIIEKKRSNKEKKGTWTQAEEDVYAGSFKSEE